MTVRQPTVLYICFDPIPSPKGACTHVTYFLRAISGRYDVTLLSLAGEGAGDSYEGARHIALDLRQENYLDRAQAFREAVWDLLEAAESFDLVHFRTMWAAQPIAEERAAQGYCTVCEVNGVESIELKYHYPALRARPDIIAKLRAQERLAFSAADAVITPSTVTRDYLLKQDVPGEKITVIPNGVDLDLFHPAASKNDGPLTALYIGTLTPWQGVDFLLEAMKKVIATTPMRLQIVSAGPRRHLRALEKLARKLGLMEWVEFLPAAPHEQIPQIIRAADICVAPLTPTERNITQGCCPLKILEYLACGKPVIASNLPVTREALTHHQNALLFHITKPARLAECLLQLAEDPALRARLGEQAAISAQGFGWERAQEGLRGVYEGVHVSAYSARGINT